MTEQPKVALEPAIIAIFGITGDLSHRKLLPALYHLVKDGLLHEHTEIVGVSRKNMTVDELLGDVELCVNEQGGLCDPAAVQKLRAHMTMYQVDLDNGDDYDKLLSYFNGLENKHGVCMNRLYYLAIPPKVYAPIVILLGEHGLNTSCQHGNARTRLLIEKPFGFNLASAQELIADTEKHFTEAQIFRIDHYVAKETVQNILTFRASNPMFAALWNNQQIASIQITAAEKIGIGGRVTFYEEVGALRDFIQSHLLQLLALTTMDISEAITSDAVHAAKLKLLNAIQILGPDDVSTHAVRGQYDSYLEEVHNESSTTETFAAVWLTINESIWQNVPCLIRTGKALAAKYTEICVVFKPTTNQNESNVLRFRIQPNEGISVTVFAKRPGFDDQSQAVVMDFSYQHSFDDHGHPDAYERVLVDAVRGDHTLFATSEEVLASWRILDSVVSVWSKENSKPAQYETGSWGPSSANELAQRANTSWLQPEKTLS